MYGEGISFTGELVDLGVKYDLVQKAGAWFSMGDTRLGQGRDNAKLYFKEHPEEAEELHKKIVEAIENERREMLSKGGKKAASKASVQSDDEEATTPSKPAKPASKSVSIDADDFDDDLEM